MAYRKDYGPLIRTGDTIHASPNVPLAQGSIWGTDSDYGIILARRCIHGIYNYAVDGGSDSVPIVPATSGGIIPAKAIVIGGILNILTGVGSTGSATVSIGTSAGSGAATIMAATAKASLGAGVYELLGNNSQAVANKAPFQMTAAGSVQLTVATAALNAGKIEYWIEFIVGAN